MGAYYLQEATEYGWIPCSWKLNGSYRLDDTQCCLDLIEDNIDLKLVA